MDELITVDGRILTGEDRYGRWTTSQLEGWWDSPDPKTRDSSMLLADGDHVERDYYDARYVSIGGQVESPSHEVQHAAMQRLASIFYTGVPGKVSVVGHGDTQWANAKLDGAVRFTPITDKLSSWQIKLRCPNPAKFGGLNSFTFAHSVPGFVLHYGSYEAYPVVTVTGYASAGYTITSSLGSFVVTQALVTANPHTIDMRTGVLTIDGVPQVGAVSSGRPLTIPPNKRITWSVESRIPVSESGPPSIKIDVYDTYI